MTPEELHAHVMSFETAEDVAEHIYAEHFGGPEYRDQRELDLQHIAAHRHEGDLR